MVHKLSELAGFPLRSSGNLFESMQSMADPVDFSGALRTLCVTLIRIANDFRLLASGPATGLDEIRLPAVQPGSSIMPGKVNPVLAEMLDMACFHVMGNDLAVTLAGQAGQLELNVMMPIIAHNLFEMEHVLIGAISAFTTKCVVGTTANTEKATGWLAKNAILVTALNPVIGYLKGAEVAKEAMATGKTIREVVLEKGYLAAERLDELLNVRTMTEGGIQGDGGGGG
jgi:fumarate hydratase class II